MIVESIISAEGRCADEVTAIKKRKQAAFSILDAAFKIPAVTLRLIIILPLDYFGPGGRS